MLRVPKNKIVESIKELIEELEKYYQPDDAENLYQYAKKKYIIFFNSLPQKMQEYWGKELIKNKEEQIHNEVD